MRCKLWIALMIGTASLCRPYSSGAQPGTPAQAFSVRDSIEMRVFNDPYTRTPGATAKEAPDGRGFVVVTTQGHLESNTLESSLWYFPRKELNEFLDRKREASPRPQLLFRKRGVPEAEQIGSYGSLITDVRWSADSRSLMFLVEEAHGLHHLYQLRISRKTPVDLTLGEAGDIISSTSRGGVTAYLVSPLRSQKRENSNTVSTVLTGHSIFETLFPQEFPDLPGVGKPWKLKIAFRGRTRTFPSGENEFFPYTAVQAFTPSIAPNGSSVLTVVPVQDVPSSWSAYRTANPLMKVIPSNTSSDRSRRQFDWPWQYALIDLMRGTIRRLFAAPTAYLTYWGGPFEAKWSRSGERVLITKTYLPLDPIQSYKDNSITPCAVAEYTLKTFTASCLAPVPLPDQGEILISVQYDASDRVVAQWTVRGKQMLRSFDPGLHQWISTDAPPPSKKLEIFIRQDMDVPPTLWVRRGTDERLLWELNPQLSSVRLGKASLYQWTDPSGYTWRGGLVLPAEPKPEGGYPLVIQTHGFYNAHEFLVDGAFTSGNAAQPLASSGIGVLQMEDRAGRHSRPAEEEADDEIRGIESAIDHLAKDHLIDRSKIGIQGFSRTSWYVERALEHSPDLYKAALIIDGVDQSYVSDVLFVPGYPTKGIEVNGSIGGSPFGSGLNKWLQNAAGFNLDRVVAPVRLEAHGTTFSVLGEWEIYSILEQQRKPVDFIDILHGQHILQGPKDRYESQQGAVDWFSFWLQGRLREGPEADAEYRRWTRMKFERGR